MQALGGLFTNIFSKMGGMGGLEKILGGFGTFEQVMNKIKMQKALSQMMSQQKLLAKYAANPSLLSAKAASAAQPLDQNLSRTVTDQTLADLTQRGLTTTSAPGVTQQAVAQALAPYQQHNLDIATQMLMSTMGMPYQAALSTASMLMNDPTDNSGFWDLFQKNAPINVPTDTASPTPPIFPGSGLPDSGGDGGQVPVFPGGDTPMPSPDDWGGWTVTGWGG